jgi:DNA-binding NarL/FixJ family response regulator
MALKVLVLEDDPFTRLSVVSALRHFGFEVVAEEAQPGHAIERALAVKPEVALLDLHLGKGATGLDVAKELRRVNPRIGIVILTSFEDPRLLGPSLPQVPKGTVYLTKKSVENLARLKAAVNESVVAARENSDSKAQTAFGKLSDVQIETLRLVALGLSNAEIAKRRFVTAKSVEVTVSRVMKSLGVSASEELNQRVHVAGIYFRSIGMNLDAAED